MAVIPRILVADDHSIVRHSLKLIIERHFQHCIVHEVENCRELLRELPGKSYSHLILDLQLKDGNAMNLFDSIRKQYPDLLILIYTMTPEEVFGKRLMEMGARGFLNKQSRMEEVLKALQLFLLGRKYISERIEKLLKQRNAVPSDPNQNPFEDLSDREITVVHNLLMGRGLKEISTEMNLKSTTISTYKARIFQKLGVTNIVELHQLARIFHFEYSGTYI